MKAKDLIEKLQELAPETEVLVWTGENSPFTTPDFVLEDAAYIEAPGEIVLER